MRAVRSHGYGDNLMKSPPPNSSSMLSKRNSCKLIVCSYSVCSMLYLFVNFQQNMPYSFQCDKCIAYVTILIWIIILCIISFKRFFQFHNQNSGKRVKNIICDIMYFRERSRNDIIQKSLKVFYNPREQTIIKQIILRTKRNFLIFVNVLIIDTFSSNSRMWQVKIHRFFCLPNSIVEWSFKTLSCISSPAIVLFLLVKLININYTEKRKLGTPFRVLVCLSCLFCLKNVKSKHILYITSLQILHFVSNSQAPVF